MRIRFQLCFLSVFLLLSFQAFSAKDPIGWQLNSTFGDQVILGRSSSITYTFVNQLPARLVKPIVIKKNASPQMEFSFVDNCTGLRLLPHQTCTVQITITPFVNGQKSVQLVISGYDSNDVPLPEIITVANDQSLSGVYGTLIQSLPATMTAGEVANYAFRYTNYGSLTATHVIASITQSLGQPSFHDDCANGVTPGILAPGSSCSVTGTYVPTASSPSVQTVTSTLSFTDAIGSPAIVSTQTIVSNPSALIVGSVVPPNFLPPLMTPGNYTVQFLFTNVSGSGVPITNGSVACVANPAGPCTFTMPASPSSDNNCFSQTLLPGASCQMKGTFTAPAATNPPTSYKLTATVPFTGLGNPAMVVTSGSVVSTLPTERTLEVLNSCPFTVRFSLNGGAVPGYSSGSCPPGTRPNTLTGLCYWENHSPNSGTFDIPASGNRTVTIPAYNYGGTQWSGNISASTVCPVGGASPCGQQYCGNATENTPCQPGVGFNQPATQAEFTLNATTQDTYDVEVINGFHIPISMKPYIYIDPSNPGNDISAIPNNYTCGTPGKFVSDNHFGACDWHTAVTPNPNFYRWVTATGHSCSPCGGGEACGLDSNLNQVCGDFLGYWSADEVCSKSSAPPSVRSYFQCDQPLSTPPYPSNSSFYNLMACSVPTGDVLPTFNTCYASYPGQPTNLIQTCCGCVDWWQPSETPGDVIVSNPSTQSCGTQINSTWTGNIQTKIQWMKKACPSAYVYPFDDKTSTFYCENTAAGAPNSTGYRIVFCEGGHDGLPNGINEGRG
jgi:hypothetical protein